MSWPDGGPWVLAGTATSARWHLAAAAIAAASAPRVALLRIVTAAQGRSAADPALLDNLATYVELAAGGTDPTRTDDAVSTVRALASTHGLVLVGADQGLVLPLGADGWTLADLAWALQAPVVVVADPGPDSAGHTILALEALDVRGLPATVITTGGDEAALPVTPAGRIPADAAELGDRFRATAPGWLDPVLHATRGRPAPARPTPPTATDSAQDPPPVPQRTAAGTDPTGPAESAADSERAAQTGPPPGAESGAAAPPSTAAARNARAAPPPRRTVSGKRVVLGLFGFFVTLVLVLCGVALAGADHRTQDPSEVRESRGAFLEPGIRQPGFPEPWTANPVLPGQPQRAPESSCPRSSGTVVPGRPDAATTARVNAAWKRIETWLAKHSPSARASLNKAAPPADIDRLQRRMSVAFPADLVASLRRHNGVKDLAGFSFPPYYQPLDLDGIFGEWQGLCAVMDDLGNLDGWWDAGYVPIAIDGGGGNLFVDQQPGGHGRVGEFYNEAGVDFARQPGSVAELLEGIARSLETGTPYAGSRPVITRDGLLDWDLD